MNIWEVAMFKISNLDGPIHEASHCLAYDLYALVVEIVAGAMFRDLMIWPEIFGCALFESVNVLFSVLWMKLEA